MPKPMVVRSKLTGLVAPLEYWAVPPEDMHLHVSGRCGPGKGFVEKLIPEKLWGLSVTKACEIHDFMYEFGEKTKEYKRAADNVFLSNMLTLVDRNTKWGWLKWLRKRAAFGYYQKVCSFGDPWFFKENGNSGIAGDPIAF